MKSKSFYPLAIAAIITMALFPSIIGFTVSPTNLNPSVEPGAYTMIGGYFTPSFSGANDYTVVLIEGNHELDGLTDSDIINRMPSRRMQPGETLTFSFNEQMSMTPGDYTYKVIVWCSEWGTEESSAIVTVHVNGQVDTTKPSVYISSHKDGDEVSTPSIILSGTSSDASGINKVGITVNGGNQIITSGTTAWSKSITLTEGTNGIVVEAYDNVNPQNIGFMALSIDYTIPVVSPVDIISPTITIQSPINDDIVGTPNIILKGITYDEIGTIEVTAKTTTGTAKTATGTATWQVPLTLDEGLNTITVIAKDAAGNTKTATHKITYSTSEDPTNNGTVVILPTPDLITDILLDQTVNINDGEQVTISGTIAHTATTSIYYDVSIYDQATGEVYAEITDILVQSGDVASFDLPQFALSPGAHTLILKADTDIPALATTRSIEVTAEGKISDPQIPDVTEKPTQAASDNDEVIYPILTFIIIWAISRKIIDYKEAS